MLIQREDGQGRQTGLYRNSVQSLAKKLREGRCLIFLGAGMSVDDQVPSLPDAKTLARELLESCELPWHDRIPLSQAADCFEFFYGRDELNLKLVERIGNHDIQPSRSIELLAELLSELRDRKVISLVITTNYDRHLERAYKRRTGEAPKVIIYKGATDPLTPNAKLNVFPPPHHEDDHLYWQPKAGCSLYKMHGCISEPQDRGLVITEEDYINFVTNALGQNDDQRKILNAVKGKLESSTILFIGYGLADWNFRALYKTTAEKRQKQSKSYAVQFRGPMIVPASGSPARPDEDLSEANWERLKEFWGKKDVDIINVKAAEFMWDLLSQVKSVRGEGVA